MEQKSPILVVAASDEGRVVGNQIANAMGYPFANIITGSVQDATNYIHSTQYSPHYIVIYIGGHTHDVLAELDTLASHCEPGTRVVVIGQTNDIHFYRALLERGVTEYFTEPAAVDDICRALLKYGSQSQHRDSFVASFMSAAAGDGSSTVALNTAYSLSKEYAARTVIVDMDYQFGMIAKNLDLSSQFGIRELFEHPERGIDTTLVERMVKGYNSNLDIIAAPNELLFYPELRPESIRDLVLALREKYKFILLHLPHMWAPWVGAAFTHSDQVMLVAQLWLKSITHASRFLNVWRDIGVNLNNVTIAINRSGAKYKEAVNPRDFERVCGKEIAYFIPNDIKTVVQAENAGKTILEIGKSKVSAEITRIAGDMYARQSGGTPDKLAQPGSKRLTFAPIAKEAN